MEKNEMYIVEITDLTSEGEGVGKIDAFPLFIKDTCVGDVVECKVMKLKKTYGFAKLMRVVEPSKDRVEARCPRAKSCGGCQIQETSYEAQLKFKTDKVKENLRRIGGFEICESDSEVSAGGVAAGGNEHLSSWQVFVQPCIGMEEPWRYRDKAQVPFGYDKNGKLVAGFYAGHTHDIIDMEDCALTPETMAEVIRAVKAWMITYKVRAYDENTHRGLVRHALIRKGFVTGEVMLCLVITAENCPHTEELLELLRKIKGFRTLSININKTTGNTILSPDTRVVYGPGYIEDLIGDVRFRISPNSFFQVNPVQTLALYGKALEFAGLSGDENVWDLYCGIGTISLFLAQKAKKVYGVEIVPQAIVDAKENATLNGFSNTEFYTGKAEEVLPEWYKKHAGERINVISVDPPRKGCDPACLETIGRMAPDRVVYVSCDSATLARDLKILTQEYCYRVEKVQPVDMFPQTVHVETCVLLSKLNSNSDLRVKFEIDAEDIYDESLMGNATYMQIKEYVKKQTGLLVTNLNIAKCKDKYGIVKRKNYNVGSGKSRVPNCPKDKEKAIFAAFRYFGMIEME